MEITLLIKSILGLVVLLAFLLYLLLLPSKTKKRVAKKASPVKKQNTDTDLISLKNIIKNRSTSSKKLQETIGLVLKYHGHIHKKLGMRAHPDFDIYMDMLFTICRHPNTSKKIIIGFDKELGRLNPEYKQDINEAITKGLNSRGL